MGGLTKQFPRSCWPPWPISYAATQIAGISVCLPSATLPQQVYSYPHSNLAIRINLASNLSRRYRLKSLELLDTSIGVAPAYHIRIWDNIAVRPSQSDFNNAFRVLRLPSVTSKTRETAFQILNRTIYTSNKAFKSRMWPNPNCERCGQTETMEHLLCECEYYSEPLRNKLAEILTMLFNDSSLDGVPRVELGQTNMIFNIPHPSLFLHVHNKTQLYCWYRRWKGTSYLQEWIFLLLRNKQPTHGGLWRTLTLAYADSAPTYNTLDS